jgi:Uma2 family endonuclease
MTPQPLPKNLDADAFIAWALEQPRGRYELSHGEIVAMAPERAGHALAKHRAARALEDGIAAAGLGCQVFPDGMSVRIDDATVYEPDALVRCGPPVSLDAVEIPDPVIVVEVVSRSSRALDTGAKLSGYLGLPSLRHYLVLDADTRTVTHHRRGGNGEILTRILRDGRLSLDPPGLAVAVPDLFPPIEA